MRQQAIDGVGAIINGNVVLLDSTEITVNSAVLNIIHEVVPVPSLGPTGAALLGGLVFGIGIVGLVISARRRLN